MRVRCLIQCLAQPSWNFGSQFYLTSQVTSPSIRKSWGVYWITMVSIQLYYITSMLFTADHSCCSLLAVKLHDHWCSELTPLDSLQHQHLKQRTSEHHYRLPHSDRTNKALDTIQATVQSKATHQIVLVCHISLVQIRLPLLAGNQKFTPLNPCRFLAFWGSNCWDETRGACSTSTVR